MLNFQIFYFFFTGQNTKNGLPGCCGLCGLHNNHTVFKDRGGLSATRFSLTWPFWLSWLSSIMRYFICFHFCQKTKIGLPGCCGLRSLHKNHSSHGQRGAN